MSTISGSPAPQASIGRLVFGPGRSVSGVASVNFNGYFLGNPVTGVYELKPDCEVSWKLQDDSGAWQHFAGRIAPGGGKVDFRQTDPGTDGTGVMEETFGACTPQRFRGTYTLTLFGISTPFAGHQPEPVTRMALANADGAGGLTLLGPKGETVGSYTLAADCFMEIAIELPSPGGGAEIHLRGILVDGGNQVLAIQTDPARVGAARFTAE